MFSRRTIRRTLFSVEDATTGFRYPLRREASSSIWVICSIWPMVAGLALLGLLGNAGARAIS